jgi:LacI family transcriptional regulator, repressor for deo operon, udp, cdd, tsx, nupC, and nupG
MEKPMNIQEVARLANVSVATVSRVLNNSPRVKEDTRKKVLSVIRKFDYQPNLLGRDLRRSETMKVLVLTPGLEKPIFADIVKGIEECAKEAGYYVLVCPTSNNWDREKELVQMVKNRLADGIITFGSKLSKEELSELGQKYNIVQCCEFNNASYNCCVSIDDEKAAFDATSHLIEMGHKRIALIGGSTLKYSTRLREHGYRKALEQYNIPYEEELIKYGEADYESGVKLTNELIQMKDLPSAIFCMNDSIAIGCVNTIKADGYSVPNDFAVVGFDNTREAIISSPALTTVHQPKYEMGYTAMQLLIHNMTNSNKKYEDVKLDHKLIVRASTAVNRIS